MTIILAKFFGLYFLALGLALLINPERFKGLYKNFIHEDSFLILGAIVALIIGAFVISVHNEWVMGWPLLITVLGWWSFIKGFALLAYPDFAKHFQFMSEKSNAFYRGIASIWLVLGAFLAYHGWTG